MANLSPSYTTAGATITVAGVGVPVVAVADTAGNVATLVNGNQPTISGMTSGVTALNAATATGPSAATDLGSMRTALALQTVVTGTPSGVTVTLEGSLDGVHWAPALLTSTSTTGDYQGRAGSPVRYIRANLTALTGGTAPTVTAIIAAAA